MTSPSGEAGEAGERRLSATQSWVAILCLTTLFLDGLDLQLLAFAAPLILKEWSIDSATFDTALSASLIGMALGSVIGGALGDRFGRRPTLIASVTAFGLGTLATTWAPDLPILIALRLGCGLGFGAAIPNAMALTSEWMPVRYRSQAVGLLAVGTPLGGVLGAAASGWIITSFGWRYCFLASGVLTLLFSLLLLWRLPESPAYHGDGRTSANPGRRRDGGGVFSGSYRRTTIALVLGFFSSLFACYVLISWLPVAITTAGLDLGTALSASFFYNLFAIAGALGAGLFVAMIGSRPAALIAVGGALASLFLTAVVLTGMTPQAAVVLALIAVAGLTTGAVQTTFYSLAVAAYDAGNRSTGVGLATTGGRIGGIVAVMTAGVTLAFDQYKLEAFFGTIMLGLCGAGVALLIFDRHVAPTIGADPARKRMS